MGRLPKTCISDYFDAISGQFHPTPSAFPYNTQKNQRFQTRMIRAWEIADRMGHKDLNLVVNSMVHGLSSKAPWRHYNVTVMARIIRWAKNYAPEMLFEWFQYTIQMMYFIQK